jgi:hypothetical protein
MFSLSLSPSLLCLFRVDPLSIIFFPSKAVFYVLFLFYFLTSIDVNSPRTSCLSDLEAQFLPFSLNRFANNILVVAINTFNIYIDLILNPKKIPNFQLGHHHGS